MSIKVFWIEPIDRATGAAEYLLPTGEHVSLSEAPVGAMWDATWYMPEWKGDDGIALIVKTPGGTWFVDGPAKNCTRRDDWERREGTSVYCKRPAHRCWVRHGDPRTGIVTVDKNGTTCGAGAGSIQCGTYHGFLREGYLT